MGLSVLIDSAKSLFQRGRTLHKPNKVWGQRSPASSLQMRNLPRHCHLLPILGNAAFLYWEQGCSLNHAGSPGSFVRRNGQWRETILSWRSNGGWDVSGALSGALHTGFCNQTNFSFCWFCHLPAVCPWPMTSPLWASVSLLAKWV